MTAASAPHLPVLTLTLALQLGVARLGEARPTAIYLGRTSSPSHKLQDHKLLYRPAKKQPAGPAADAPGAAVWAGSAAAVAFVSGEGSDVSEAALAQVDSNSTPAPFFRDLYHTRGCIFYVRCACV